MTDVVITVVQKGKGRHWSVVKCAVQEVEWKFSDSRLEILVLNFTALQNLRVIVGTSITASVFRLPARSNFRH